MTPPPPLPPQECIVQFLEQAQRLSIEVRWTREGMHKMNAAYHAFHGTPGLILLRDRDPRPSPKQICTLLSHEMVHVLQHWKGKLKAVPSLGWARDGAPPGRELSIQEKEAYTAQTQPRKVLRAVNQLKPFGPQRSP